MVSVVEPESSADGAEEGAGPLSENISAVRSGGCPRHRINCTDERMI